MVIRYQPVDKQYILQCINPNRKHRGRREFTQTFKHFNVSRNSDYFEFGIISRGRPELGVLNETMIDNIKKKYSFCSVTREQFGDALEVICKRDRWNECSHCGTKFWAEKGDESYDYQEMYDYKNKSLCNKCYKKAMKIDG